MPAKPDEDAPRGGTRGGLELFKWDSLKNASHKEREHYLGYSAKLGNQVSGNWQKNDWWQKDREKAKTIDEERKAVKEYEDEIFKEALGLKPKNLLLVKSKLSTDQMKDLLRKTQVAEKPGNSKKRKADEVSEVVNPENSGLGFRKDGKATTWAPSKGEEISRSINKRRE